MTDDYQGGALPGNIPQRSSSRSGQHSGRLAPIRVVLAGIAIAYQFVVIHHGQVVAAGPVLDALTPQILQAVFGVNAVAESHPDGVIRVHYSAAPFANPT